MTITFIKTLNTPGVNTSRHNALRIQRISKANLRREGYVCLKSAERAAKLRDDYYFGPPLNHVARLLAVGHVGQTLLAKIAHALCGVLISAGAAVESLGEHSLKDLIRREKVFQLCHPDLPQAFRPLKTQP